MDTPPSAIETLCLSKSLAGRRVLRDVDLTIAPGESVALIGCNGSGKTTLLRCLAAITRPSSGAVRWFGQPAAQAHQQRRQVAWVGHGHGLYTNLTVRENLLFAARMGSITDAPRHVESTLERFGLRAMADQQVRHASRGMLQRTTLARAMIMNPLILLLDEPFTGLDESSCAWLAELLGEQRGKGRAICFTTHVGTHAREVADRIVALRNGRLWPADESGAARVPADGRWIAA